MNLLKFIVICMLASLAGCAVLPAPDNRAAPDQSSAPLTLEEPKEILGWRHQAFPGKRANLYFPTQKDGIQAVGVQADASVSVLKRDMRIESRDLAEANFSWQVPGLIQQADMADKEADDSPVRIVLAFEGDRSKFSAKDAMLSELSRALTGEELPYATLMYVWSNKRQPGTVIVNPRTNRIRKIVVESGPKNLNRWMIYRRDVKADFEAAFGEAPGALLTVALMTDTDNTRTKAKAWYGPVVFDANRPNSLDAQGDRTQRP